MQVDNFDIMMKVLHLLTHSFYSSLFQGGQLCLSFIKDSGGKTETVRSVQTPMGIFWFMVIFGSIIKIE